MGKQHLLHCQAMPAGLIHLPPYKPPLLQLPFRPISAALPHINPHHWSLSGPARLPALSGLRPKGGGGWGAGVGSIFSVPSLLSSSVYVAPFSISWELQFVLLCLSVCPSARLYTSTERRITMSHPGNGRAQRGPFFCVAPPALCPAPCSVAPPEVGLQGEFRLVPCRHNWSSYTLVCQPAWCGVLAMSGEHQHHIGNRGEELKAWLNCPGTGLCTKVRHPHHHRHP